MTVVGRLALLSHFTIDFISNAQNASLAPAVGAYSLSYTWKLIRGIIAFLPWHWFEILGYSNQCPSCPLRASDLHAAVTSAYRYRVRRWITTSLSTFPHMTPVSHSRHLKLIDAVSESTRRCFWGPPLRWLGSVENRARTPPYIQAKKSGLTRCSLLSHFLKTASSPVLTDCSNRRESWYSTLS